MMGRPVAVSWEAPDPRALRPQVCADLIEHALEECPGTVVLPPSAPGQIPRLTGYVVGWRGPIGRCPEFGGRLDGAGRTFGPGPEHLMAPLLGALHAANDSTWGLEFDAYSVIVKRYGPGGHHEAHMDWQPSASLGNAKVAVSVPLNAPEDYEGGVLVINPDRPGEVATATTVGTVNAFPCWSWHEVRPVTRGERWAAIVFAYGPRLR